MEDNYLIIMAGGVGTRLWPFSRNKHPKQFQDILNVGKTLLQQTAERFEPLFKKENIYVVTTSNFYSLVKQQLPYLSDEQILQEPMMRNTAACIAYATYKIASKNPKANFVVTPADHSIANEEYFRECVGYVLSQTAQNDILVTLGISPSRPDTGYGYIQYNPNKREVEELYKVKTFTEKPDYDHAVQFLATGEFLWNAGIFMWNANAITTAFRLHEPDLHDIFSEISALYYTEKEKKAIETAYMKSKKISIDYAILEKASNVYVLKTELNWSDLGTWKSIHDKSEKDANNNVVMGEALLEDVENSIVRTPSGMLVAIKGLKDYIVAEHDGVLLIFPMSDEQSVKDYINKLRENKLDQYI